MNRNWSKILLVIVVLMGNLAAIQPPANVIGLSALKHLRGFVKQGAGSQAVLQSLDASLVSTGYTWVDITSIGTPLTLADWGDDDDEGEASVPLPWAFPWFGNTYTTVYIDPNGNVGFDQGLGISYNGDNRIPSAESPNNRIAAFYEDMAGPNDGACEGTGAVYIYYDAGGDRLIIQYDRWCSWEDGQLNTFEVILFPDGRVIVQYNTVPSAPANLSLGEPAGDSAIGIEGPSGENGYAWSGAVADGTAWAYGQEIPFFGNKIYLPFLQSRAGGFQAVADTSLFTDDDLSGLTGDLDEFQTSADDDSSAYLKPETAGVGKRRPYEERCHNAFKAASRISP